jgi:hypothetical protein
VLASFGEALSCDSFLASVGGHVWFDMVVPVMFAVYYCVLVMDPAELDPADPKPHALVGGGKHADVPAEVVMKVPAAAVRGVETVETVN